MWIETTTTVNRVIPIPNIPLMTALPTVELCELPLAFKITLIIETTTVTIP